VDHAPGLTELLERWKTELFGERGVLVDHLR
jgi:hypothetical protein